MIRRVLSKLGIDKAIGFTIVGRFIQGFGGLVTVLFIARYLTKVEQGFYYTFASLLAIQVFFELGLGGIITQFVAHENSHLKWTSSYQITGEQRHISRLASLLQFCVKWYFILSIALVGFLIVIGLLYFNFFYTSEEPVTWEIPWIMLCLGTVLNFLIVPISAFLEGLNKVKEIAQCRLLVQIITIAVVWGGFLLGAKLYVGGIASISGALIFFIYIYVANHWKYISALLKVKVVELIHYKSEIFPFQWKVAMSWISGYLIFQLFNPILFATQGAVVAGQMGMTLTIANAILAMSFSWMATKQPVFAGYIAQKNYQQLDLLFSRAFRQSTIINVVALSCAFILIVSIKYFNIKLGAQQLGERFLDSVSTIFLLLSFLLNHIIGAWALYLRCHKQEPFLVHSISLGLVSVLIIYCTTMFSGVQGLTIGYFLTVLCFTPWAYYIYKTKKHIWHNGE